MPPRRRLAVSLRSTEPLVGFVARRGGGGGLIAARSSCASRCCAAWRFNHWERCSAATTTSTPSTSRSASRARARCLRCSGNAAVALRSNTSSTRESVVFTPWPPGPEAREKRQPSSPAGIHQHSSICRSGTAMGVS